MRILGINLGGGPAESDEARQRREASSRSLQSGGLPLNAMDRLREQASRQGTPQHFFTSDLGVNELLLVERAGFEALGQVMGSSVYHVGWQWQTMGWQNWAQTNGYSSELDVLTRAFYNARHLALGRLQQEAALLGASGVVGVRIKHKEQEWADGLLEFTAIGTAIREPEVKTKQPFLSALSGRDFYLLLQTGYRPVGVAVGNCTYYTMPSWGTQMTTGGGLLGALFGGSLQNQELVDYTQALYAARSLAMTRMEREAMALHSEGIVGVDLQVEAKEHKVEVNNRERIDMLYHFTAIGTAIAPGWTQHPLAVQPTLSLKRRRRHPPAARPLQVLDDDDDDDDDEISEGE